MREIKHSKNEKVRSEKRNGEETELEGFKDHEPVWRNR